MSEKIHTAPAPVKRGPDCLVQMWLDHQRVGCGYRHFLVLKEGHKWTRLVCVGGFVSFTIPTAQYRAAKPEPVKMSRTRLIRRIRDEAKTYGKCPKKALAAVNASA